jgi:LuxR family maltose regulon positive regulatory protein
MPWYNRRTMLEPLLMTKLYIPPPRPGLVPRPHLTQRLDESLQSGCKLTLVSAPAGFGKTTLLVEWLHGRRDNSSDLRAAWISLDEGDNDPARFLLYLTTSLRGLGLTLEQGLLEALRSPQPPPVESVLASLVNDLAHSPGVLVLDDYHVIKARAVHDAVAFLLDHLPPPPRAPQLVIGSRSDPPLFLARLRGRGLLTELRVADLRFTEHEAATLLQKVAGLPVPAEGIAALEARTEGWVTGLRLAAIALQRAASVPGGDVPRFIQEFTGSHRFVLDYLVEEVFAQQPLHIKRFLLQTSILDRLSAPLCEAVCFGPDGPPGDREDAQEILEALERANLFLVPLDGARRWYRYHRLFADLLRSRLPRLGPELGCAPAGELHHRASVWYEAQGLLAEAVAHALVVDDGERAADLIEAHGLQMLKLGKMTALLGWLDALPARTVRLRPQLCIYQAWALALSGRIEEAESSLQAAEAGTKTESLDDRSGQIAAIRAYVAAHRGDVRQTVDLAHQALALLDETNLVVRSVVAYTLGGVHLMGGDLAAAVGSLTQATEMGQAAGNVHLAVPANALLADLKVQQGQLHGAFEAYQQALEMAGHSPVAAQAHSGMGTILYEWNKLEAAARHLARSIELGRLWGNREALSSDYVSLARLHLARGDLPGASDAMQEAKRLVAGRDLHLSAAAQVAAGQLRLAVSTDDLPAVERWVRACSLEVEGQISPILEQEYVALARGLLALGQTGAAGRLLNRLLEGVEKEERLGRGIEILILQALAHRARGDQEQALTLLTRALTVAEPETYVRTFLDEGRALRSLLSDLRSRLADQAGVAGAPDRGRLLAYTQDLLAAFAASGSGVSPVSGADRGPIPGAGLVEPLSEREMEVLRLVADGLTNQAIADRLFIALSTVKSHTNSIYGKLAVQNRTQAVAKARSLRLL